VSEALKNDIERRFRALQNLRSLFPSEDLDKTEKVHGSMNELISSEYEPYFCGNAALHILSRCQRCGRCCRDEAAIALSPEDCRRIARHLGISLKRFMKEYTRAHSLKDPSIGNARMARKTENESCVFYDPRLPGCAVQEVKPQVCSAAYYLSKMNLLLCDESRSFSSFPKCPADIKLRSELEEYAVRLRQDPDAINNLVLAFKSDQPDIRWFKTLLRLKGMEIYFGRKTGDALGRKLGLARLPNNDELTDACFLYAVVVLDSNGRDS